MGSYYNLISGNIKQYVLRNLYAFVTSIKLPYKTNRLLIIKLDAIGDYVIFRNSLQLIKEDPVYGKYHITLLGNIAYKDLAEKFDSDYISNFLWIHPSLLSYESKQKLKLLWQLKLKGFDVVINPVHSRFYDADNFIKEIKGKKTIGSIGDAIRLTEAEKILSDNFYNILIPVPDYKEFEFLRNAAFIKGLLNLQNKELTLQLSVKSSIAHENSFKIVIFPGATSDYRRWSPGNFAVLVKHLNEKVKNSIHFFIAGSTQDVGLAHEIKNNLSNTSINITDLTGKTSLSELTELIGSSNLLISNETSAVHIAAATKTPFVCISNGSHFGRFNPYPKNMAPSSITVYPDEIFYNHSMHSALAEKYKQYSTLDINSISVSNVGEKTLDLLSRQKR
jgi:ADP-heptose:LPS heptosyltransferase